MARPARILAVTLGLTLTGAVFGGLAGVVAFALAVLVTEGFIGAADVQILPFAGYFGAAIGAVAAPAAGWLLLRRVPLGRAVVSTVAGAVAGGVTGWTLGEQFATTLDGVSALGDPFVSAVLGAVAGFLIAAFILRRRASMREKQSAKLRNPPDN